MHTTVCTSTLDGEVCHPHVFGRPDLTHICAASTVGWSLVSNTSVVPPRHVPMTGKVTLCSPVPRTHTVYKFHTQLKKKGY